MVKDIYSTMAWDSPHTHRADDSADYEEDLDETSVTLILQTDIEDRFTGTANQTQMQNRCALL